MSQDNSSIYTDSAEALAISAIRTKFPDLSVRAGSVVHELVVRPLAYVYGKWRSELDTAWKERCPSNLLLSTLTENPVADEVASFYGVKRKEASVSTGVVTVCLQSPSLVISRAFSMTVSGVQITVPALTIISSTYGQETTSYNRDSGDTIYVRPIRNGLTYIARFAVEASQKGSAEVPEGVAVEYSEEDTNIISMTLTSPLSGGSDGETDASLIRRALDNLDGYGVGTVYAIKRLIEQSGVHVLGLNTTGTDDILSSAYDNGLLAGLSGNIDVFVRTKTQPAIKTISVPVVAAAQDICSAYIDSSDTAGAIGVTGVRIGGVALEKYSVEFVGEQLSSRQQLSIAFNTTDAEALSLSDADVDIMYMPAVADLQAFMDKCDNVFVGHRFTIKSAIPVRLSLSFMSDVAITTETAKGVKSAVVNYINSLPVGFGEVNFTDIQQAVRTTTGIDISLPCTMTGVTTLRTGSKHSFSSTCGILRVDSQGVEESWPSSICFFYTTGDDIRLEHRV